MANRTYPYMSVQDRYVNWEFYLTVKPQKRIYVQGISKDKLAKMKKKTAANLYEKTRDSIDLGFSSRSKAEAARHFYNRIFGREAVVKSRLQ